ncbi:hypothetical protein ACRS52_02485 [Bacillus cytotoxicus]|nr:hypothetical protein [Bacillus cytotoxicus]QTR83238.1 hypothetical protein JC777_01285 [Bacillus cytotoxicus]QTR86976.1 hypothetical protein JC774_21305 [Bacillus cytotoxicus]
MANRETIRDTENTRFFLKKIEEFLKKHDSLERLNREKANHQVSSTSTTKMLESILGKSTRDSLLKNLFKENPLGLKSNNITAVKDKDNKKEKLYEFPTYMKVNGIESMDTHSISTVLSCPLDRFSIKININATEDYFVRDENPGKLEVRIKNINKEEKKGGGTKPGNNKTFGSPFTVARTSLENGTMSIMFAPKEGELNIGDELEIELNLKDTNNNFTHIIPVKFIDRDKKKRKISNKKRTEKLELPPLIQVYREQEIIDRLDETNEEKENYQTWKSLGWDLDTGRDKVIKLEPGIDDLPVSCIYINMNCQALEQILVEDGGTGTRKALIRNQFLTQIYMQAFLNAVAMVKIEKKKEEVSNLSENGMDMEEFIEKMIDETAYIQVKMQINNIIHTKELEVV